MVSSIVFIVAGRQTRVLTRVIVSLVFVNLLDVIFVSLVQINATMIKEPAENLTGGRKIV